ncbi:MAG: ribosome silencing factor [Actinomycetota bacterium]|nr:ribosome silencing factor [Actinomycetota bacterium]MDD5668248.1 ribosome silencing factor [Actinomycetota bacterium]
MEWGRSGWRRCVAADSRETAIEAARAASDKKAHDILVMDMRDVLIITDYFIICSGKTDRQVRSIQEGVEERLAAMGVKPVRREGVQHRRWILLDYVDIVVHVFRQEEREYYEIERLWKDAPNITWEDGTSGVADSR